MNGTVYLRLVGGLGNQLYQYAFATLIREKLNYDKIYLDVSGMSSYREVWGFLLNEIIDDRLELLDENYKKELIFRLRLPRILQNIPTFASYAGLISDRNGLDYMTEKRYGPFRNVYLDGYFQYTELVSSYTDVIRKKLRPDLKIDFPETALVINVRGGEFVRLGWTSLKDRTRYQDAINRIKAEREISEVHLVTDDVLFSKDLLAGVCDIDVVHNPNPIENFKVLMSSKHKILSSSTFSQWAGFLSPKHAHVEWI